jgi:hypothetical protein
MLRSQPMALALSVFAPAETRSPAARRLEGKKAVLS